MENADIARIFARMADLLEIQAANPFRIRAYRNAGRILQELPDRLDLLARTHPDQLTELPGIGQDLAGKICEICQTGRLAALAALERTAPPGVLDLLQLPGLGPKRAKLLCDRLHIHSLPQLRAAAQAGRISRLKGFGEKSQQKILQELAARTGDEMRMLRPLADQYANSLLAYLRELPGLDRIEMAGSFRRRRETIGDLDILVAAPPDLAIVPHFIAYPQAGEILSSGSTRASIRLHCGLQVDLRVVPPQSYGAALYYFTGSKAHNIAVRRLGQQHGLKINEYGVFQGVKCLAGEDEHSLFTRLGLPWIPPELREDRGEIEAARNGTLPRLVELADIRGDLHTHTTDSDGRDSLDAMADAAEALGYEYLAVTDHSPALRMVRGLDEAGFRRQAARIDRLNARLRKLRILKGAEVDIHPDGTLDLNDRLLQSLDLVLVSIHSKFDLPPDAQTRRILTALRHPAVNILAHPTGRLIGKRRPIALDLDEIFHVAAQESVLLEINAQPERLDLDDVAARAAIAHGLTLVVSTDSHATHELSFMRWGVDQARRAWAEKTNIANTLPLADLLTLLHR